jgi:ribosomal protein S18 acetylase RimI-like enzyme
MEMVLVRAGEADLGEVVALANVAYRSAGADASWNSEAGIVKGVRTTVEFLREDLAAKPEARLLIWRDEGMSGLMGTVWLEPKGNEVWYLGLLTVRPGLQNRGLGRELLATAEKYVRAQGGTQVRMTVLSVRKALIEWYERRGYALTGETEAFPYGDERFGKPLRDDLSFVVMKRDI